MNAVFDVDVARFVWWAPRSASVTAATPSPDVRGLAFGTGADARCPAVTPSNDPNARDEEWSRWEQHDDD